MDIEILLTELKTLSPEKQIIKLKMLKATSTAEQLEIIERAAEGVGQPWLSNALLNIVNSRKEKKHSQELPIEIIDSIDTIDTASIKSEAVSESIGQVLHELEPIIGSINVFVKKEILNFNESKTKYELEKLNEVLETFEDWRRVEQSPKYKEINVYNVIKEEVVRISPKSSVDINLDISQDLVYFLAPSLLRIIVSNALRNSVESCNQPTVRDKSSIVIRGSATNKSIWFCIIDDGLGLQNKSEVLLKSRHTTKVGNRGLGLAIIEKAISSMGGEWKLSNSKPNGAELYFEIPKKDF
jgi:signal transduction histidine kinase